MTAGGKKRSPQKVQQVLLDASDLEPRTESMREIGGSASKALNSMLANQAIRTVWSSPQTSAPDWELSYVASARALMEFKPADGIEGMLAAQAFGLHNAAMECLRRAMVPDQSFEVADLLRRQAAHLSRAFLDVLAGLDRKRGKGGHQLVRIERVQVGPGAHAAIVGTVQAGATAAAVPHAAPPLAIGQEPSGPTLDAFVRPQPALAKADPSEEGGGA